MAEQQPPRTKRDRIERLRRRLADKPASYGSEEVMKLRNVIKGILDLLDDEL